MIALSQRSPSANLRPWRWWGLAAAIAVGWSLSQANLGGGQLVNPGGWVQVWAFVRAALHPELGADFLALTVRAAFVTLAYAVCGTAFSLAIGLAGGVLASETWWNALQRLTGPAAIHGRPGLLNRLMRRGPWTAARAALALPRAIHEVIWGLFFVHILGLNPLAAVLGIAIPFGAITAKVFSEILDETAPEPLQALLSAGAPASAALWYSTLPQALPGLVSYAFYRLECAIRAAAVLGVIGAGGLGQEVLLSFQSLKYREMWTLLWALVVLSGLVDAWSGLVRRRLGASTRIALDAGGAWDLGAAGGPTVSGRPDEARGDAPTFVAPPRADLIVTGGIHSTTADRPSTVARPSTGGRRDPVVWSSMVGVAVLIPTCFWLLKVDFSTLWAERAARLFAQVRAQSLPPDWDPALLWELARQTGRTLAVSILAITIAAAGGLLCALPAAGNFMLPGPLRAAGSGRLWERAAGWAVMIATRLLLLLERAIPASVWALIFMFVLFPGVLPGALALGVYTMGVLGRLMAEVVEDLDPRPLKALATLGAPPPAVFAYGALPRALPGFLSYSLYRWEVCSRETVVVGVVGAAGLGRVLSEQLSNFDYHAITTTLLFFIGLTFAVDLIGAAARRALRAG